jgi:hypothetical protein
MYQAFNYVMVAVFLAEVNCAVNQLNMPVKKPVLISDLRSKHISRPDRYLDGGMLKVGNYFFTFGENTHLIITGKSDRYGYNNWTVKRSCSLIEVEDL